MKRPIDPMKELGRTEGLRPLPRAKDAWESVVTLPRSEFHGLLFLARNRERLFFTTAMDTWDRRLAVAIMRFTRKHESALYDPRPLAIVEGFADPRGKFDAIAAVSHDVHRMWNVINPRVTRRTVVLYPIYRCELAGDESVEVMRTLIHIIGVGDWARRPSPLAWMRFSNTKTGVRTTNKGLGVDTADTLYDAIAEMTTRGSFADAKNFKQQLLRIEYRDAGLWITRPGAPPTKTTKKAAIALAKRFLEEGL